MESLAISGIVFASVVGGTLAGFLLRTRLSAEHLSADTKDIVKLAMGLIATMTALVLGLMVASAKNTYDTQRNGLAQLAGNVIFLDRVLVRCGPEAASVREALRNSVVDLHQRTWPNEGTQPSAAGGTEGRYEHIYDLIEGLRLANDSQRAAQAQAIKTAGDIGQARWLLFAQKGRSIPIPFLVVVVAWATLLFASFSLFAPRNTVTLVALSAGALAVAGAMFLILELDQPFAGVLRVPSTPIRAALDQLGH